MQLCPQHMLRVVTETDANDSSRFILIGYFLVHRILFLFPREETITILVK